MKIDRVSIAMAFTLAACTADPGPRVLSYDEFKAKAYLEPDTQMYVINGDELVTNEDGMRAAYDAYVSEAVTADLGYSTTSQGLTINRPGGPYGADGKWPSTTAANLTYCVSQSSFGANYSTVVSAMAAASAAWQAGANVRFVHSAASDASYSTSTGVVFNVRQVTGQPFLARSFFPTDARSAREVLIDTSSFGNVSPFTLAGILRHELGHTLGFRHEHTRPEAGTCFEDNNWRAVTSYDSASVMHYPQCNGTNRGDLLLTGRDKLGARLIYPFSPADILWRCVPRAPATACGGVVAGGTAIWIDGNAGRTILPGAVDFNWQIQGLGDFDGDGKSDILWHSVNGDNVIWFGGQAPGLWISAVDTGWQVAGIGDFDNNGKSDILWRSVYGDNAIWTDSTAPGFWISRFDTGWRVAGLGDFDGDGKSDILWRCVPQAPATACGGVAAGGTEIWIDGNAGRTILPGAVDFNWQIQGLGDFDGDGKSDILWRSVNGDNVIWFGGQAPGLWITPLDTGWRVAGIGDFDGNGKSDILWRHVNGDNAIWHDGSAATSYLSSLDNNWQVAGVGNFAP